MGATLVNTYRERRRLGIWVGSIKELAMDLCLLSGAVEYVGGKGRLRSRCRAGQGQKDHPEGPATEWVGYRERSLRGGEKVLFRRRSAWNNVQMCWRSVCSRSRIEKAWGGYSQSAWRRWIAARLKRGNALNARPMYPSVARRAL